MPTYDYLCTACGHEFEEYQSMTAKVLTKCPNCGKKSLKRLIGTGAAIVFKGSGFYQTDYRSDSYKKAAEADSKSSTSSDTKPDAKTPETSTSGKPSDAGAATPKSSETPKPSSSTTDSKSSKPSDTAKSSDGSKPQDSAQGKPDAKTDSSKPTDPKPTSRSVTGGRAGRGKGNVTPRKPKRR